ncbi:hypothetical protein OG895_36670 [Streptomyces sp. NBC_00201]|nr:MULTISPECIES: hypothetical protein [unclassified Streptomyces]MCX4879278.1 hypothetical protein [Streptomyces sp. NBC_00847]MCX5250671.1 hypothetical protein [Streptomyces sp. NBC_00201]MCX5291400.1 hypothetical protein [Streptomyces sp. NBC_00183]
MRVTLSLIAGWCATGELGVGWSYGVSSGGDSDGFFDGEQGALASGAERGQELDQRLVLADPLRSKLPGRWRVSLTYLSQPAIGVVGSEALEGDGLGPSKSWAGHVAGSVAVGVCGC